MIANLTGNLVASEPIGRRLQLETLQEIDRLLRLPPGRIGQWPEALIERNLPEEET